MPFKIKIAGYVFEINTRFEDTLNMCKDYLTDEDSVFSICINDDDIEYERQKSIAEAAYEGLVYEEFSEGYLETISVYRKIAEYISNDNATVFHGVLLSLNNEGYLFTGRSGIGKTTHVSNWLKMYPECVVINGDKPILKIENDSLIGYGTPWSGKEGLNQNDSVKIKAIIKVTRGETNSIKEIELKNFISDLLSATYRSKENDGIKKAMEIAVKIGSNAKLYQLTCNMDKESAKVAYEGINL